MSEIKHISQLVNAHKVSSILLPLIEACEINRRQQSVKQMELSDLFKEVIETSKSLMQSIADERGDLFSSETLPDQLLMVMSKTLGNSVILYNQPSLSMFFDDAVALLKRCHSDIYLMAGHKESASQEEREKVDGFLAGEILEAVMPVLLFHTNLYVSGILKTQEDLKDLNDKACLFMVEMIGRIIGKFKEEQGRHDSVVSQSNISITASICSHVVKDYQGKLIKNKDSLRAYVDNPQSVLSKLVPAIVTNINTMNQVVHSVIKK
jgi:hypothetical protein